ncbi:MAG: dihydrodipicolinate synthase family protein [Chloroflexi bacterium]|nr:dihydrodipicolinate synthase family protein [Chloroflexota bacterium]
MAQLAPRIEGIFPAMLTMFTASGELDLAASAEHADWLVKAGVQGLVLSGTSGEFIAMSMAERRALFAAVIERVAGRVPVYACTSAYGDRATIELTEAVEELGAAGAVLLPPIYQKPPKPAIIEHFRAIRRHTSLPLMYYDNPAYAGTVELNAWEVTELVKEGVFQSIKHTFASNAGIHDLRYLCPAEFRVFHGGFRTALEGLAGGAHGWISGFLNAFPERCVALHQTVCVENDLRRGQAIWQRIIPYTHLFYAPDGLGNAANDLAIWRHVLELRGRHGGDSRPPFYPLTDAQKETVRATFSQIENDG